MPHRAAMTAGCVSEERHSGPHGSASDPESICVAPEVDPGHTRTDGVCSRTSVAHDVPHTPDAVPAFVAGLLVLGPLVEGLPFVSPLFAAVVARHDRPVT